MRCDYCAGIICVIGVCNYDMVGAPQATATTGLRRLEKIKILSQDGEVENCLWWQRKVSSTCSDDKVTETGVSFHYQGRTLSQKVLCCFWCLVAFLACVVWFVTYFVLEVSKVVVSCKDMG